MFKYAKSKTESETTGRWLAVISQIVLRHVRTVLIHQFYHTTNASSVSPPHYTSYPTLVFFSMQPEASLFIISFHCSLVKEFIMNRKSKGKEEQW